MNVNKFSLEFVIFSVHYTLGLSVDEDMGNVDIKKNEVPV